MAKKSWVFGFVAFNIAVVSFILFVGPLEFVDVEVYELFFVVFLFPAFAVVFLFVKKGWRACLMIVPFWGIGMFFLYQGFYGGRGSSIIDYFLYKDFEYVVDLGNGTVIYRTPISYYFVESLLLYCLSVIIGFIIAWFKPLRKA